MASTLLGIFLGIWFTPGNFAFARNTAVMDCHWGKIADEPDNLSRIALGKMSLRSAKTTSEAKAVYTKWVRQAAAYVVGLEGPAILRANVYEELCKEIQKRSQRMNFEPGVERVTWDYRRITLPSGVEFFVGSKGFFFEIRPDGRCFSGRLSWSGEGESPFLRPDWLPPYDESGNPTEPIESRALVE